MRFADNRGPVRGSSMCAIESCRICLEGSAACVRAKVDFSTAKSHSREVSRICVAKSAATKRNESVRPKSHEARLQCHTLILLPLPREVSDALDSVRGHSGVECRIRLCDTTEHPVQFERLPHPRGRRRVHETRMARESPYG